MNATAAQGTIVCIPDLLKRNIATLSHKTAYREKEFGIWQSWTWADVGEETRSIALGLIELGAAEGDHIAIIGRNRPAMYWSMLASQMAGCVPVPLYQDAAADEVAYALENCGARFAIVGDQEQVDKISDVREGLSNLEHVIYLDPKGLRRYDHTALTSLKDIQAQGRTSTKQPEMEARIAALDYDSTCVMLYTSGTTGRPKGVVLSNRNVIETARNTAEFDTLSADEEVLAYLPMAWVGDFIFSIGHAYWAGFCVNCPESAETMNTDLREIGPSYFFAPPAIFENYLTQVMIRMEDAGRFKRWLYTFFMDHAKRVGPKILDGEVVGAWDRFKYTMGNVFIYGPLKNQLGMSRVRVGYTAGEAIGPELFSFYRSLGINLKQLYGQTEATVFITQQPDGQVRDDTVGVPSPGVELKINDEGEVYYRSPGVFVEYFNNPDSTASTKDSEGWVATGDAGFIEDASGHLRIIDRIKDVGKMANGSLFAPKYVENKLKFYPNILEAVVFGAGKQRCTAFINIDLTAVGNWAERNNIPYTSYQEISQNPKVLEIIKGHVNAVNESVSRDEMLSGCQIHRFVVLHKELDADDGEMTRTRKVRRAVVGEKFADIVDALDGDVSEIYTETEVTYEDGRKGQINATLQICDATIVEVSTAKVAAE